MPNYFRANKKSSGGGANLQTKTITAGTSSILVEPDSGYDGLSEVTVNPTPSQTKSVTATTSAQTVDPDSGKLLSSVTVNPQSHSSTAGTYTSNGTKDLGANHNYRYVNISVSASFSETLLWTNPNPASSMSSSTRILDNGDFTSYKYYKFIYKGGTSTTGQSIEIEVIISKEAFRQTKDAAGGTFVCGACRIGSNNYIRRIWYDASDRFTVGTGQKTTDNTTDNGACIPYKIYGLS